MVWYFHLFQNFPQFIVIHTVKGFGIVSKAEIDVFLELSCFFHVIYFSRLHQALAVARELCVAARGLSCCGSRACRLSSRGAWASLLHST